MMEIKFIDDIFVINLRGSLDSVTSRDLKKYLDEKRKKGYYRILINCDSLDFISSGGISFLLQLYQEVEKGNFSFALQDINREILSLFSLLGLTAKLPIFSSRQDCESYLLQTECVQQDQGRGFSFHQKVEQNLDIEEDLEANENPVIEEDLEDKNPIYPQKENEANSRVVEEIKTQPKEEHLMESTLVSYEDPAEKIVHYTKPVEKESSEKEQESFSQLKIQCPSCGQGLLVKNQGKNKCPVCCDEFQVSTRGEIEFNQSKTPEQEPEYLESVCVADTIAQDKIVFCESCQATLRVDKPGKYKCPQCCSGFAVGENGDIEFTQKPGESFSASVIFCESCGERLRIKQTGIHKCPQCSVEFDVRQNGSVSYFEKLV